MDVVTQLQEIHERATKVGLQRRDDPKDDLLSAIATYRDGNGELLPEHRITEFCSLIIGGGNDTTTSLLSQAFIWLSEHPEQAGVAAGRPHANQGCL